MATNAARNEAQYFNFEEGTSSLLTRDERKTGERSMKAVDFFPTNADSRIEFSLKENVAYRVSFWAKKGTATLASQPTLRFAGQGLAQNQASVGGALQTAGQWEYFAGTITPTQAGTITMSVHAGNFAGSGQYHFIDDVRIHPLDAQMETYAYEPLLLQPSAITNKNGVTTHYEYDVMGRLIHIRDQDWNLRRRFIARRSKPTKKTRAEFDRGKYDKKLQQQIDEAIILFGGPRKQPLQLKTVLPAFRLSPIRWTSVRRSSKETSKRIFWREEISLKRCGRRISMCERGARRNAGIKGIHRKICGHQSRARQLVGQNSSAA